MIHICDPSYKHEIVTLCYQLIDVLCTIVFCASSTYMYVYLIFFGQFNTAIVLDV